MASSRGNSPNEGDKADQAVTPDIGAQRSVETMTNPPAATVSLRLLVIRTGQMDKVRAFYQSIGIELAAEQHGKGPVHYAAQIGDAVFEIYPLHEAGVSDATTRLGFAVPNLDEVVTSMRATGVEVFSPPQQTAWGYRAVVRDPDGRAVELYQAGDRRP